jgi:hypothetical protein
MNKKSLVFLTMVVSLSVGCVGMGLTISPADGRVSLDFQARDCITDNLAGRSISAVPYVGDWAMLNFGCHATDGPLVGQDAPQ